MLRALAVAIQSVLDTILPRKERIVRIDDYTLENIPISPEEHDMCGMRITTLMKYREKAVEDLIRALKYDRSGHAAALLSSVLSEFLREEIASIRAFTTKSVILVPIPLHESRMKERGFNQIEKILYALPEEFRNGAIARVEPNLLIRNRATPPQTRLSKAERLKNVSGTFTLRSEMPDAHFFLIDDVATTGATLSEGAKAFKSAPISLLALAHA